MEDLLESFSELDPQKDIRAWNRQDYQGNTFKEAAAISYILLKQASSDINVVHTASFVLFDSPTQTRNEEIHPFKEEFIGTLYDYLEESIDEQKLLSDLLFSFKHRSEWFNSQLLWELAKSDSKKAEHLLSQSLYLYLYDAGIDVTIEPASLRGRIDLIASQRNSENKLLADAKIFDAENRGKAYLLKGFRQIYTYCQQYIENVGYLVIFKITEKDLDFALTEEISGLPSVIYNNKTISFLTIDIHNYEEPVSQRKPLHAVTITREELIQSIEEEE